mgnify:CR=1 FL=1
MAPRCQRTRKSRAALVEYQRLFAADTHFQSLHDQRCAALRAMQLLQEFEPRLVGPVLAGTATEHADVDLHLFADRAEAVTLKLMDVGIPHELIERRVKMFTDRSVNLPAVRFEAGLTPSMRRFSRATAFAKHPSARSTAGRCVAPAMRNCAP